MSLLHLFPTSTNSRAVHAWICSLPIRIRSPPPQISRTNTVSVSRFRGPAGRGDDATVWLRALLQDVHLPVRPVETSARLRLQSQFLLSALRVHEQPQVERQVAHRTRARQIDQHEEKSDYSRRWNDEGIA